MSSFINIDFGEKTPRKLLRKHILFSVLWFLAILVLVFRIDIFAINLLNAELKWLVSLSPLILLAFSLITIFSQKWYFSLAAIFYPILVIFWFLPKTILDKGKIYLFTHYVNYIYTRLSNYKKTITHYSLFILTILLLILTDNPIVRIISMTIMSYFYFRFVLGYLKTSFKPAQMFGTSIESALNEFIEEKEVTSMKFIETMIKPTKEDYELPKEQLKKKRLKKLVMWNYGLNYISKNLSGFKGKKAYVISWGLQLSYFFLISIIYFTFTNYQLFNVNPSHYFTQGIPNIFEFFYYTIKTITFSGIENIKPESIFSKCIEIGSFLVIGLFILILVTSVIFSLRQDKIKENVELATEVCAIQNDYIINEIRNDFGITVQSAMQEFVDIKKSVINLKKIIDKLF